MSKRIAVFLSSHSGLPESYREAAEAVGHWIGVKGHTLVYGGARKGLMEVLAQATKTNGGKVFGVVPQILVENNQVSDTLDITFHCVDLNDRKAIMVRESEIFVALPGGIGTLDEIFTVLAANTIGIQSKPVVLYNVDHCWDKTVAVLKEMRDQNLVSDEALAQLHVVSHIDELNQVCESL